jgi:hypothetical protein
MRDNQKQRIAFTLKFKNLSQTFQINSQSLNSFLKNYEQKYIQAVKDLQSTNFSYGLTDTRKVHEYLYDLCEGWIMEDLICWKLKNLSQGSYSVKMNGCEISESGRKILTNKISSKSDLLIKGNKRTQKLEIQFANKDRNTYDIKETKIKEAQKEQALVFVYSLPLEKGFLIDPLSPAQMQASSLINNQGWGGKLSYQFYKEDIQKIGGFISLEELSQKLKERV